MNCEPHPILLDADDNNRRLEQDCGSLVWNIKEKPWLPCGEGHTFAFDDGFDPLGFIC